MGLLQTLNLPPRASQGTQATDAGDTAAAGAKTAPALNNNGKLSQAAEAWRKTHGQAGERIAALKKAVTAQCADADPALAQEVEKGLAKLDGVLKTVDLRLADAMAKAELKSAKAILTEYITYVKSEPLVAHMDQNPFNVKTDLKTLFSSGLAEAAKAIG